MNICHQLLGIDEGAQRLLLIDTEDKKFGWTIDLTDFPCARDMQRIAWNRAIVGFERGFLEVDILSGRILNVCENWAGVTAVTRRVDGCTLLTGWNLDGSGGVNVLTLDAEFNTTNVARREGDYVRLMRTTPTGSYLLSTNDRILETREDLTLLREFRADGFEHAWLAERLSDGSTLVSAGYGATMARFDSNGCLTLSYGHERDLPLEVKPFFYATFQILQGSGVLVANWQGHGADNGRKGQQLLEFNHSGKLLGAWSDSDRISSLQGLLLLS